MSRLAAYRHIERLSQAELADTLKVARQQVSEIERGLRPLDIVNLETTGYSNDRLSRIPDMSEPLHRHFTRTLKTAKLRAQEIVRLAGELYPELLADTKVVSRLEPEASSTERDLEDIEELAVDVRVAVLGCEPEGRITNLTGLVERAGVALVPLIDPAGDPTVRTIDGASSWVYSASGHDAQPVIGLDPQVPGERFRFSLAHELGHLIMHSTRHAYTEDEANRFAGALLVPRATFEEVFADVDTPTLSDFLNLKGTFGVSVAALIYRARDLELISQERFRSLQIQKSSAWSRKKEPNDSPVNVPGLFTTLVERRGGVAAAAGELGVPEQHLRLLVDWDPPRRAHLRVV